MFDKKEKEKEKENEDNPYSKDKDQSRFIAISAALSFATLLGLFLLEFLHDPTHPPRFFTSEICHILINGMVLSFGGLAGYVFGKSQGTNEMLAKMAGGMGNGNGTNGNGKNKTNNTQTSTVQKKQNGETQK